MIERGGREKIGEENFINDIWDFGLVFCMDDGLIGWDVEYSSRRSRFGVKNNRCFVVFLSLGVCGMFDIE